MKDLMLTGFVSEGIEVEFWFTEETGKYVLLGFTQQPNGMWKLDAADMDSTTKIVTYDREWRNPVQGMIDVVHNDFNRFINCTQFSA